MPQGEFLNVEVQQALNITNCESASCDRLQHSDWSYVYLQLSDWSFIQKPVWSRTRTLMNLYKYSTMYPGQYIRHFGALFAITVLGKQI